ncbi:MAG: M15 family metallopeptidase [Clostridiales Family XIII bacterium]|jgi:D-alanyl-D-alanine carboxypeptidase|nr:M15 family metallopeptidase [Clostridiales Family XIII bacterium]
MSARRRKARLNFGRLLMALVFVLLIAFIFYKFTQSVYDDFIEKRDGAGDLVSQDAPPRGAPDGGVDSADGGTDGAGDGTDGADSGTDGAGSGTDSAGDGTDSVDGSTDGAGCGTDGAGVGTDGAGDGTDGADGSTDGAGAAFEGFYYFEADKADRYAAYAAQNPEMPPGDVVWRVNADVDRPPYTDVATITDFSHPLMVNKHRRLPDGFEPAGLVETSSGQRMTQDTKTAYEAMRDAASAAGFRISAASSYRTIEYQKGLYNRYVTQDGREAADTYSARAGHSEHHTGTTIDLIGPAGTLRGFVGTPEAAWVAENAHIYGFIVRYTEENSDVTGYTPEPWHVTWVGADIAGAMRSEGIGSLEEYVVKHVDHRPGE